MSISQMPTMSLLANKYRKGEKLVAARAFDLAYGTESVAVAEGTEANVISETGEPLVVQFKGVEQAVSIPMTDAEKFLLRAPVKENVDTERLRRTLLLSEDVIKETRFPTKVSESSGRQIRCTNIDGNFTMRPFSLIPGENLQSLIGKTGEIVFEYMELGSGGPVYKCNFQEAGRVALKASEFEYVEPGKSGSLDNKSESRRALRPALTENDNGVDEARNFAPKAIYNSKGHVLCSCDNCGKLNYVEPHGTTHHCTSKKCSGADQEHSNIPHTHRNMGGTVMTKPLSKNESVTDEDFLDEAKCTICHKPIKLTPTAKERAAKFGGKASDYTKTFTTHSHCAIAKRNADTDDLIKRHYSK